MKEKQSRTKKNINTANLVSKFKSNSFDYINGFIIPETTKFSDGYPDPVRTVYGYRYCNGYVREKYVDMRYQPEVYHTLAEYTNHGELSSYDNTGGSDFHLILVEAPYEKYQWSKIDYVAVAIRTEAGYIFPSECIVEMDGVEYKSQQTYSKLLKHDHLKRPYIYYLIPYIDRKGKEEKPLIGMPLYEALTKNGTAKKMNFYFSKIKDYAPVINDFFSHGYTLAFEFVVPRVYNQNGQILFGFDSTNSEDDQFVTKVNRGYAETISGHKVELLKLSFINGHNSRSQIRMHIAFLEDINDGTLVLPLQSDITIDIAGIARCSLDRIPFIDEDIRYPLSIGVPCGFDTYDSGILGTLIWHLSRSEGRRVRMIIGGIRRIY